MPLNVFLHCFSWVRGGPAFIEEYEEAYLKRRHEMQSLSALQNVDEGRI
jgi:hypothetical protein